MPQQLSPEQFAELLESYDSAVRLSAVSEIVERRQKVLDAFEQKQLEDGEFRIEGNVFGAWLVARGRIAPRNAADPEHLATFLGNLVGRLLSGIEEMLQEFQRRARKAGGN